MDNGNVIPHPVAFRPHVIAGEAAPENVTPRRSFGLRQRTTGLDQVLDVALGRPEDRAQQDRIRRLAREARNALDGRHVCPSLIISIANRVSGLADAAERLAEEAKSLGLLKAATQLRDHAGLLELVSAEIEAEKSA